MGHFVHTRQRWLIDPANSSTAQANTLLVTGVPQRYLTEAALKNLFSYLPGGVAKVWLNRYVLTRAFPSPVAHSAQGFEGNPGAVRTPGQRMQGPRVR